MKNHKILFYLFLPFFGYQACSFASEFNPKVEAIVLYDNQSITTFFEKREDEPFSFKDLAIKGLEENLTPSPAFTQARTVKTESDLKSLVNDIVMHNELTGPLFVFLMQRAFELNSSYTIQRLHSFKANNQKNGDKSAMFAQIEWGLLNLAVCYGKETFLDDIFSSFGSPFMESFNRDENEMLIKHFNPYFLAVQYKKKEILEKLFMFRNYAPEKMKPIEYDGWFCDLIFYSVDQKNVDAFSYLITAVNTCDLCVPFEKMIELSWAFASKESFASNKVEYSLKEKLFNASQKSKKTVEGKDANDQHKALMWDYEVLDKMLNKKN